MITKKLFLILFFFFATILFFINQLLSFQKKFEGKIYPGIFVNEINLGGKTKAESEQIFQSLNKKLEKEKIIVYYKDQPIATFSGQQLNLHYDQTTIARVYSFGREKNLFQRLLHLTQLFLIKKPISLRTSVNYDRIMIKNFIQSQEDRYNKPARNALFKFENNRVVAFKKEEEGEMILSQTFFEQWEKIITHNRQPIKTITLPVKKIKPEITLASANRFGIEEEVGVGSSNFSGSLSERIHNIILAASKLNGVLIEPNKVFSFNETIGDISSLTGYKPAYIIKEGRTILSDGGGVCQVSTTLFRAALNAGLPIIERHAHAYRVHYYENDSQPGLDATVFAPSVDLKFKNDTAAYLLIQTNVDSQNNSLTVVLYGKKDGRKIMISPISVWDIAPPPPPIYQDDPTLKKGVIKQIEWPAWGAKTSFSYQIIKNNKVIFEKTFYSYYRPWPAVYLVGVAD